MYNMFPLKILKIASDERENNSRGNNWVIISIFPMQLLIPLETARFNYAKASNIQVSKIWDSG